ncbi:MAG: hypothetical protein RL757_2576 [Bacteroidota bacterium]|jgi:hypothetical protein
MAQARRNHQADAPPAPIAPKQPSFLRILLLGCLGLMAVGLILQAAGVPIGKRTESDQWVDQNSAAVQNRKMSDRKQRAEMPDVATNAVLDEIANEFEGKVFTDLKEANQQKGWGLSDQEASFYDKLRDRYASSGSNWLNVVRRGKSVYATLNTIFGRETNLQTLFADAQKAGQVYKQIQEIYNIPTEKSQQFSAQGRDLSDWATFVEANSRN